MKSMWDRLLETYSEVMMAIVSKHFGAIFLDSSMIYNQPGVCKLRCILRCELFHIVTLSNDGDRNWHSPVCTTLWVETTGKNHYDRNRMGTKVSAIVDKNKV